MDTKDLQLLIDVAEHLSFAKVARLHNIDPSAVSRTISNIEAQLGVSLFHRTTRQMQLTQAGKSYLADITPLVAGLSEADRKLKAQDKRPHGKVRLTASTAFGNQMLLPLVPKIKHHLPQIELHLSLTDQNVDLVSGQIDLAIRLTDTPKGDFKCVKLMDTRYQIVAAPHLKLRIDKPQQLSHQDCLLLDLPKYRDQWRFKREGKTKLVSVSGRTHLSNPLALLQAAKLGLGPALLPDWLTREALEHGALEALLPEWQVTATSFNTAAWLIYPNQKFMPTATRAVADFLKENIG